MKQTPHFDKFFAVLTCIVLLACFVYGVVFSDDVNTYENRPANKIPLLSVSAYLEGTWQDGVENALMDQMPLSETLKRFYNNTSTSVLALAMKPMMDSRPERYVSFRDLLLYGGEYLCYAPKTLSDLRSGLDRRIEQLNGIVLENNDVDIYLYYIECDVDTNFETGEKSGIWEYLSVKLDLPEERMGRLEVPDFETYSGFFYQTDHHWNHAGAYKGYTEIAQMLGVEKEELLQPVETLTAVRPLIGTKANRVGTSVLRETFQAYRFASPEMQISVNGQPAEDYGTPFETYLSDSAWPGYTSFYGFDEGEVIFDTGRAELDNILLLGNSYDNAVLSLLAAHYNMTYAVDLRYYETDMGTEFNFTSYLQEHDIDRVLLIGDNSYFSGDLFMMGGE